MKTALIAPVPHLDRWGTGDFHLLLSHLFDVPGYLAHYRQRRLQGDYIILDNGAHENTAGMAVADLLENADRVRASEIVLPDVLFDHLGTLGRTHEALGQMIGPLQKEVAFPRLMLVPQGRTFENWEWCFRALIETYVKHQMDRPDLIPRSPVIGVSKDYETWDGGVSRILEFLEPFRTWMTFDVHLLGWGRHLGRLHEMAREFPWVRSTDSAKPFVYAMHGLAIDPRPEAEQPEYPTRPADYFIRTIPDMDLAQHNVEVFQEWADGNLT